MLAFSLYSYTHVVNLCRLSHHRGIGCRNIIIVIILTSTSDLPPSTAISNLSLGKSVFTNLNHYNATTYL